MDLPRGTRLDFEVSGKLKGTSTIAAQRGTKVVVERIFHNLPVRKKELEKNIKREYSKVLTLLQAYACISTGVRFTVSNQMPKGYYIFTLQTDVIKMTDHSAGQKFRPSLPMVVQLPRTTSLKFLARKAYGTWLRSISSLRCSLPHPRFQLMMAHLAGSKLKATYPDQCWEKVVQRQTDKCSMSTRGLAVFLKLQKPSTRSTNPSTFRSLLSFLRI